MGGGGGPGHAEPGRAAAAGQGPAWAAAGPHEPPGVGRGALSPPPRRHVHLRGAGRGQQRVH